jgi:hypothetical protein
MRAPYRREREQTAASRGGRLLRGGTGVSARRYMRREQPG